MAENAPPVQEMGNEPVLEFGEEGSRTWTVSLGKFRPRRGALGILLDEETRDGPYQDIFTILYIADGLGVAKYNEECDPESRIRVGDRVLS